MHPVRTLVAVLLLTSVGIMSAHSQATSQCAEEYNQAETAYFNAEFDRAIRLLRTCLEEADLRPATQIRFYRLLGFAYIAQGNHSAARTAVERILDLDPDYAPDPETDRPDYVELVREVKADREAATQPDRGRRWLRWVLGGVGVAAAAALTAIFLGGGDTDDTLPTPPVPDN